MKLVDGWQFSWKWFSQQAHLLQIGLLAVWESIPTDLRANIPPQYLLYVTGAIGFLGLIGRIVDQTKPEVPNV